MKNICIFGDSWGLGELGIINFITGKRGVTHRGLEFYLKEDGHQVTNISIGGGSNIDAFNSLLTTDFKTFDLIFNFQSDPIRDYRPYTQPNLLRTIENIKKFNHDALCNHYERLNSLNKEIYLIGGCSKINTSLIKQYKNLKVFIPSVVEFLTPHLENPEIYLSDWIDLVNKKNCDPDAFMYIYNQKKIQDKIKDPKEDYYYNPDGRHTNRNGHRKIYEKVKAELLV